MYVILADGVVWVWIFGANCGRAILALSTTLHGVPFCAWYEMPLLGLARLAVGEKDKCVTLGKGGEAPY